MHDDAAEQVIGRIHSTPSQKKAGFVLTNREIINLIYEFRLLRREQLSPLARRHTKADRRPLKLVHRYLTVIRLP